MQKSIVAFHIICKFTQTYCLEYPGRQNFYVAPYKQFLNSTMPKTKNKNSSFYNCQIELYNSTFVELLHILWITLYVIKLMDTILYLIIMLDRIEKNIYQMALDRNYLRVQKFSGKFHHFHMYVGILPTCPYMDHKKIDIRKTY